jgi:hypothetical protein
VPLPYCSSERLPGADRWFALLTRCRARCAAIGWSKFRDWQTVGLELFQF